MGYACPVCALPQADGEHLADHLAITALLHGDGEGSDDHEAWLEEHVPDWSERSAQNLAPDVTPLADEVEYETAFEAPEEDGGPAAGHHHGHGHQHHHVQGAPRDSTPRRVESSRRLGS